MPRPKGSEKIKHSGRKKGTPNKDKITLQEKAKELGVDPFEILLLFADNRWKELGYPDRQKVVAYSSTGLPIKDDFIDAALRQKSAADACQYIHAKRKAIEIEDKNDLKPIIIYQSEWGSKQEASDVGEDSSPEEGS